MLFRWRLFLICAVVVESGKSCLLRYKPELKLNFNTLQITFSDYEKKKRGEENVKKLINRLKLRMFLNIFWVKSVASRSKQPLFMATNSTNADLFYFEEIFYATPVKNKNPRIWFVFRHKVAFEGAWWLETSVQSQSCTAKPGVCQWDHPRRCLQGPSSVFQL